MRLAVMLCLLWLCACSAREPGSGSFVYTEADAWRAAASNGLAFSDERLRQAAAAALGEREGAIIIIDPQSGRLRAVVNPRIAFEQAYPPGSAIKPFAALLAMRIGLIDRETSHQCGGRYVNGDYSIVCTHPRSKAPFNLPQALGYSCNSYFALVGERLNAGSYNKLLAGFGLGARTGVNAANEAAGRLPQGEWRVQEALGDSDRLLVTPIQLLTAYSALVNGGTLYRPQLVAQLVAPSGDFAPQETASFKLAPQQRAVLLEGMRGAVKYGTAAKAGAAQLPFYFFGKTGTSEASNGYHTQGWFIGFAAQKANNNLPMPQDIGLGILVFLKRSHGSVCAEVAKNVLAQAFERSAAPRGAGSQSTIVKVHSFKENVTYELSLEDYVTGVVSAEDSTENQLEALKALAVVSRTYALKNRYRHTRDGYDFCSSTHCQLFWSDAEHKRRAVVVQAVESTAGEVLSDSKGKIADSYFHAACGGMTANIAGLWGVTPPPVYLRGVRDDYCELRPNRVWSDAIPAAQLALALQSDPKTNVGGGLAAIQVVERDATGRAALLALTGQTQRVVRGWDFKLAVGRKLGWQHIKSSRFAVRRVGDQFVFEGSGFGHGLGLCQEGAGVMAGQGLSYQQLLGFYFPGASLRGAARESF